MTGQQEREPGERSAVPRDDLLQHQSTGWRSPWLSFNIIRRRVDIRQEEPRGVGGEEEWELFDFHPRSLISNNWSLCLVGWICIVL